MLSRAVRRLEEFLFAHRGKVLLLLVAITVVMAWQASKLRMSAGFDKMLPANHEYINTFNQYRDQLYDANQLAVVVHPRHGDIWTPQALKTLLDVTQAVTFLQGVNRGSVISLWTPNVFWTQITEEGFKA